MPDVPDIKGWIRYAKRGADYKFGPDSPQSKRLEQMLADEIAAEEAMSEAAVRILAILWIAFFSVAQGFGWYTLFQFAEAGDGDAMIAFGAIVVVVVSPVVIAHLWLTVFRK